LEEYLAQRSKSEDKFGYSESERRDVFKEVIVAEDKGQAEADLKYPTGADAVLDENLNKAEISERISNNVDMARELQEKYRMEVLQKYNLTQEQGRKITVEALTEGWAF
jgi:hypothetical protein